MSTDASASSVPPPYTLFDPSFDRTDPNKMGHELAKVVERIEELQRELELETERERKQAMPQDYDDIDDPDYEPDTDEEDTDADADASLDVTLSDDEGEGKDIQFIGINLAPNPAIPALVAPALALGGIPGVRHEGPWVAGTPYGIVPTAPLVVNPTLKSHKYHAVYCGRFVGVVTVLPLAESAVHGVAEGCKEYFKTQDAAVFAFNEALRLRAVSIKY